MRLQFKYSVGEWNSYSYVTKLLLGLISAERFDSSRYLLMNNVTAAI